jgi:succinate dehydrogenase/fumarate reductase flavoprotein subunit
LDVSGETASIGAAAADELKNALMNAQGADIDGVSGATLTSKAVMKAASKCIQQAKGEIPVEVVETGSTDAAAADWLGEAPEVAEADITETWDTDFLIVGAGNGGLTAAAYAAKQGLNFRIIEKGTEHARVRGWYGAINTDQIVAEGGYCDRGSLLRELKKYSSGKCDLDLFNVWYDESAAMHQFIVDCYAEYAADATCTVTTGDEAHWPDEDPTGLFFPVCEHFWNASINRLDMFEQIVQDYGNTAVDYSTSLVKLEQGADGNVTGVIAQNTDTGAYIRINASKGVLLACGGYPYNVKMMEQLDPMGTAVTTYNNGWPTDTGDGIKAAKWIGADMQPEAAPMLFDRGIVAPGVDAGYEVTSTGDKHFPATWGQFNVGTQPFLKVNRKGERFANESGTYDQMSYAAYGQPGGVYASIFDSNMPDDVQRFHTLGCSAGTRKNPQGQLDNLAKAAEQGEAFIADTIEELADKLGFEGEAKETFLATVEKYNAMYDAQEDTQFGKPAYRLSAIRQAPFYGFWMGACLLTTEQGILCNTKAQVKDTNGDAIEGLYVCGDNAGGFFYNNYPCVMPGIAMGRNMTFAIKAVKNAFGLDV